MQGTWLARPQSGTIRLKLLWGGVGIRVSVRVVRLSFDEGIREESLFRHVLTRLRHLRRSQRIHLLDGLQMIRRWLIRRQWR